jgi:hypothetical protein
MRPGCTPPGIVLHRFCNQYNHLAWITVGRLCDSDLHLFSIAPNNQKGKPEHKFHKEHITYNRISAFRFSSHTPYETRQGKFGCFCYFCGTKYRKNNKNTQIYLPGWVVTKNEFKPRRWIVSSVGLPLVSSQP